MTPFEALVDEVRDLKKQLAGERLRANQRLLEGTVHRVQGAKVEVLISDDGDDGPIPTPPLRMAAHTGNAGQGVSEFSRMGVGEAVLVVSPNGKVGTGSVVLPWADTQEHPAAGIAEQDGRVIQRGNARLDLRDGHIRLSVGGSTITLIDGTLTIEAETVQVRGTYLRHNARSISDTHVHTDVEPGGSTSGPPL